MNTAKIRRLLLLSILLWALPCAAKQPSNKVVSIDRIVVLISSSKGSENASIPVLASDVTFQALLSLAIENGPSWAERSIDENIRKRALRVIVLTRFLARTARQVGSDPDSNEVARIRKWIMSRIGGRYSMQSLLDKSGTSISDLDRWIGDYLLAQEQITYIRERLTPLSDKELRANFLSGEHPFLGNEFEHVRHQYQRYYDRLRTRKEIAKLLGEAFATGRISFLR